MVDSSYEPSSYVQDIPFGAGCSSYPSNVFCSFHGGHHRLFRVAQGSGAEEDPCRYDPWMLFVSIFFATYILKLRLPGEVFVG
jgi:hypothetical protein